MKYKGFTLWLTGLSGSGKTTIAQGVAERLRTQGRRCTNEG
ncbi:adenylyl-sulfate kinase [Pseudanabaena yagii]|uniref:Adenylyl-sulfate kinase n=1 Tax=Pseudanabaena yagii GIHE-NHR1 TaxID=2722753 RepID=A0ABX1LR94_9CYAN|nr:adenylyl-sulfate kinase [Pseudanabaena yagii]NMF58658.1 adenylyl-sulfate kinase [Pseudanabaena yagii GIHE-NHR1]